MQHSGETLKAPTNETTASLVLEKLSNTPIHLSTDPSLHPDAFNQICKKNPTNLKCQYICDFCLVVKNSVSMLATLVKKVASQGISQQNERGRAWWTTFRGVALTATRWHSCTKCRSNVFYHRLGPRMHRGPSFSWPSFHARMWRNAATHTRPTESWGGTAPIPRADRRLKTQISRRCNQVLITCFVLAKKNVHSCAPTQSTPNPSCAVR